MLNLLKQDGEVQSVILNRQNSDEGLRVITEQKLRPLVQIAGREVRERSSERLLGVE